MPVDSFSGSLTSRYRGFRGRKKKIKKPKPEEQNTWNQEYYDLGSGGRFPYGASNHAHWHDFALYNPVMVETMISNTNGESVLQTLKPYTEPRADKDSSDRYSPPSCHEDTRIQIRTKLLANSLKDPSRQFNMTWLRGFAGTGKSAVAQTFAQQCEARNHFGAGYFFSRPRGWNKYKTVIPSIAYQLALHCPAYKFALTSQLTNDPQLLDKSPPVQFKQLITHPLLMAQANLRRQLKAPLGPFLVFLDGLDECETEEAQCELIELIADAVRVHKDLPIVWPICSRPEEHLQYVFAEVVECGREELVIDADCVKDVKRFLRGGFAEIRAKKRSIVSPEWPSEYEFNIVERAVNGLFIFGSVALKDIGKSTDPVRRLRSLLSFLKDPEGTSATDHLHSLDLFYTRILDDVSETIFPTTWRILAFFMHMPQRKLLEPAQALCNFLEIDQAMFYAALRQLHSVISIPTPEDAGRMPLRFYHASFQDFLLNRRRSGKSYISQKKALVEVIKSILFWHEFDSVHFHAADGLVRFDGGHDGEHGPLPNLKWLSQENKASISDMNLGYVENLDILFKLFQGLARELRLLSIVQNLDFRYINMGRVPEYFFLYFIPWVYRQDPTRGFLRTEPRDEVDRRLLSYMGVAVGRPAWPTLLSHILRSWTSMSIPRRKAELPEYFFIGKGFKSVIVWHEIQYQRIEVRALNCDRVPTPERIAEIQRSAGYL